MLAKCANPECVAVFRHLGDGKLSHLPRVKTTSGSSGVPKKMVAIEHFWLCSKCAESMTLGVDRHGKIEMVLLPSACDAAAS